MQKKINFEKILQLTKAMNVIKNTVWKLFYLGYSKNDVNF